MLADSTASVNPCQLVCIPPDMAPEIWPHVEGLIWVAMKQGGLSSFQAVKDSVLSGGSGTLLWIAWDQTKTGRDAIEAAAITELHQTEWRKVCLIVACGGSRLSEWVNFIGGLEKYARDERCTATRIMGRRGWIQFLPDYHLKRVVLEKGLN